MQSVCCKFDFWLFFLKKTTFSPWWFPVWVCSCADCQSCLPRPAAFALGLAVMTGAGADRCARVWHCVCSVEGGSLARSPRVRSLVVTLQLHTREEQIAEIGFRLKP